MSWFAGRRIPNVDFYAPEGVSFRGIPISGGSMKTKTIVAAAVLLFILALGLTLYPLISNFYNARHQSQIHTAY